MWASDPARQPLAKLARRQFAALVRLDETIELDRGLRETIEARAVRLIIQRDDPGAFAELDARFDRLRRAAEADDRERFAALDFEFHEDLTRLSGNSRLHRVFVNQAGVLRTLLRLEITTQYTSLDGILSEHEHLLKEIRSRDRARAQAACELHLEQASERVIRMRAS
jgi:GntR family transcriptional regulator, rspAB operon transcriptional repressor